MSWSPLPFCVWDMGGLGSAKCHRVFQESKDWDGTSRIVKILFSISSFIFFLPRNLCLQLPQWGLPNTVWGKWQARRTRREPIQRGCLWCLLSEWVWAAWRVSLCPDPQPNSEDKPRPLSARFPVVQVKEEKSAASWRWEMQETVAGNSGGRHPVQAGADGDSVSSVIMCFFVCLFFNFLLKDSRSTMLWEFQV